MSIRNNKIAYDHFAGTGPCVIFCGGFNSSRMGNKAMALQRHCMRKKREYICFDYQAHGESPGDFGACTISTWLDDTLSIIDSVCQNQTAVLVGSSMGGWLALLAAQRRPNRITGLLLIACAVDMTASYPERLRGVPILEDSMGRPYYALPSEYDNEKPYRIYKSLIEDGRQYKLLNTEATFNVPMWLFHGQQDSVVPWQRSLSVLNQLAAGNATLTLIKQGDHRLSSDADLRCITDSLDALIASL